MLTVLAGLPGTGKAREIAGDIERLVEDEGTNKYQGKHNENQVGR
jgi:hypothetical protein